MRAKGPHGAQAPGVEQSGVQAREHEHELSRAVAQALLEGSDDPAAEAAAWEALAARLRAMGIDPST